MTEENKRMLYYIKTQMKAGVTFPQIANNFGYFKEEEKQMTEKQIKDLGGTMTDEEMEIKNIKDSLVRGKVFGALRIIENLEKENKELKAQIAKMKSTTEELIKIQSLSIEDSYNAGLFNGFVTVFNSIFFEKFTCCSWDENKSKWELNQND